MDENTDRYVVRSNNFASAARYAAEQNWRLSEWAWLPAYTVHSTIQVFERMRNEGS